MIALEAAARRADDGASWELCAPAVGLWRGAPAAGDVVTGGCALGALEVLGVLHELRAPATVSGVVTWRPDTDRARIPIAFGARLLVVDPPGLGVDAGAAAPAAEDDAAAAGLVFAAPSSGRFYSRPAPDQPPFVAVGDVIEPGHAVCLLEIMKTFNRVAYGGAGLPARARVTAVVPDDGDDLGAGDPILHVEPE